MHKLTSIEVIELRTNTTKCWRQLFTREITVCTGLVISCRVLHPDTTVYIYTDLNKLLKK